MSSMVKWKNAYLETLNKMNNDDLFNEYSSLLTEIDNDGVRSVSDEWKLTQVSAMLMKRLRDCGFLS